MTAQQPFTIQDQYHPGSTGYQKSSLVNLAEDFAALERPSQKEISKFREMFYVLVLRTTREERKKIGQSLSKSHFLPRQIAYYFCLEEVGIASSVLLFSPVLKNEDLRQVIAKRQIEHAIIIARRVGLDSATISALLAKDDSQEKIRYTLSRNTSVVVDSELSHMVANFAKPKGPQNNTLLSEVVGLSGQSNNGKPISIHAKLVQRFSDIKGEPSQTISDDLSMKDKTDELLTVSRLSNSTNPKNLVASDQGLADQLLVSARARDIQTLASTISIRTSLDQQYILDAIYEENTGIQACLFKALGLKPSETSMLLLLLNRDIGKSVEVFRRVKAKLDSYSIQKCREIFITKGANFNSIEPNASPRKRHESHFTTALLERQRESAPNKVDDSEKNRLAVAESA